MIYIDLESSDQVPYTQFETTAGDVMRYEIDLKDKSELPSCNSCCRSHWLVFVRNK